MERPTLPELLTFLEETVRSKDSYWDNHTAWVLSPDTGEAVEQSLRQVFEQTRGALSSVLEEEAIMARFGNDNGY